MARGPAARVRFNEGDNPRPPVTAERVRKVLGLAKPAGT